MIFPDTKIEKELLSRGRQIVVGIDEAGRGPLAGPVVAGAAWVNPEFLDEDFELRNLIRDSKLLSHKQREKVYEYISSSENFVIGIGEVSHSIIDEVNILNATFLAMRFALEDLMEKISLSPAVGNAYMRSLQGNKFEPTILLVDGTRKIPRVDCQQYTFPKGDQKIFSIAVASICAKVYRDRLMDEMHKKYPQYGFSVHRGYGTQMHMEKLKQFGPCKIHRRSFAPLNQNSKH